MDTENHLIKLMENRLSMKLNVVPVPPVGKIHLSSGEIAAQKAIDDTFDKFGEDAKREIIEKKHCFRCGNGMTKERDCGHCKHLQIDGMFGMWCDIYNYDWMNIDAGYCSEFTR